MTKVVNLRDLPFGWQSDARYVYVGRAGKGLSGKWGNPHRIGRCSCGQIHDRDQVVEVFEREARARYAADPVYRREVEALRDKFLVCFCAPRRCHGEVYVALLHPLPVPEKRAA